MWLTKKILKKKAKTRNLFKIIKILNLMKKKPIRYLIKRPKFLFRNRKTKKRKNKKKVISKHY